MSDKEAEMTHYLTEHKIEELFRDITMKLILNRPTDALEFIKKHITEIQKAKSSKGGDEDMGPAAQRKVSRRGGVSASVMDTEEALEYQKKVNRSFVLNYVTTTYFLFSVCICLSMCTWRILYIINIFIYIYIYIYI